MRKKRCKSETRRKCNMFPYKGFISRICLKKNYKLVIKRHAAYKNGQKL